MDERTKSQLERGRESYRSGDYRKAVRALVPLAKQGLPFADVYAMLGVMYHADGKSDQARKMLEEAVRLNPTYTEAALNLAVIYNELGQYQDAKRVYKAATDGRKNATLNAVDPFIRGKIANMHAEVGRAYEQAGLFDQAAGEYKRALELSPTFVDIRTRLAISLRAAGNFGAAEREFLKVKRENPKLIAPRLQLGMTFYAAGRRIDAAREWREVLELEPENQFARLYLRLVAPAVVKPRRPLA